MKAKLLALLLVLCLTFTVCAFAEEAAVEHTPVAIFYTNDTHCGVHDGVGFAGLAAYINAYAKAGYDTGLVDCGDAVQGAAIGTISRGELPMQIMNGIGYEVATVGNHEFDYGMERFFELVEMADFPYVSANFTDMEGNPCLDAYVILEKGGWKIAFVGVSTPETFVKSTPTYFQDENGNYIYTFCEGGDGEKLFAAVQAAVDAAREEGADIVVALTHMGTDASSEPYTSSNLITKTTGIDVVMDGHSHSVWSGEEVLNAEGETVILTSTGTKLANVGIMTIDAEGNITTSLHDETIFQDDDAAAMIAEVEADLNEMLSTVIATTAVDLTTVDPVAVTEDGKPVRIVRTQETNLGDLCADAYLYISGADIAFVNGGGIRANIPAGDITFDQTIAVHPYGNMLTVIEATGQQILDALEHGSKALPGESGGFLHVAGMTYEINAGIESTVEVDDKGMFVQVAGDRRVQNVMIAGEPIDPEKTYTVASHNYMLLDAGDGYCMFKGCNVLQDSTMLDNQVLINYMVEGLGGVVGEEYADPYGQGRITIVE